MMVATLTPETASCALKTAALVALLLIGWVELGRKRTRICGRVRGATLLDLAQLVLCFAGAFVYFAKSYLEWPENSPVNISHETTLSSAVTDCIAAIATVIVCLASLRRFFSAQYTSSYLLFVLALGFTASTTDFCRSQERLKITNQALTKENDFKTSLLVLNLLALLLTAGNMVVCGLRDTIVYNHRSFKFEHACEEGSWSPLGLFACAPIHRCLKNIIGKSNTNIRRFVKPCLHSQCSTTVAALYAKAKTGALPGSKARLVFALWCVTWREVLWIIASGIAYYLTLIARALVLETLIAGTSSTSCMVALFAMACVAEGSFTCYTNHLSLRFSERVQVLTQGAIFRRVLNYSPTTRATTSPGYIASVMGVDCTLISFNSQMMLSPLPGLLTMPIVVYMLTARVGIGPGLCCGSILLAALVGFWVFVAAYYRYQRRTMKLRDDRVKRMLDLLSSIRTVKMYAWEKSHLDGLNHLRNKELKDVLKINLISGTVDALYSAMSSLTNLALGRVVALCTAEETSDDCLIGTDSCVQKGEVLLQGCTFSRTNKEDCVPALERIDLSVRPGSLVAIVGFVGSGKSTLLSAILGDMHRVKGTVRINGTIGYVPQAASVFNATLRDNILFGKPYDPLLYRAVLEACELVKDINTFPARDHTEIGEKGYNLSGGQKQRVSLARAAYHQCSIYVLDDPLSALDPHVGSKVFKKLLGKNGLLKDKTRILVTNQGYLLKHADQLFLMCGRTGVPYSSLAELFKDKRAPTTLMLGNAGTLALQNEKTMEGRDISAGESDGKIIKEEKNVSTKSVADVMWTALKMCGWSLWPGVLCFAVSAVTTSWQLVWIKQWTDANGPDSASDPYDPRWTRGLVGLSAMAVISRLSGSILLAFAMNRLSGVLHSAMLERVLFSPVSFFDATPRGRILNRFTTDLSGVDNRMASLSRNMVQNSLIALSRLAVIGTESVAVIGVGLVVLVLFTFGTVLLVRAVNATRFIQSAHFSRLLQHVTETVDSLTMVRVFGMTQRFYQRFCRLADQNLRVSLASVTCSRLARTFAMGCSQFMVLTTLVFTVAIGGDVNEYEDTSRSSSIGLALNSSLSIPMTMAMLCVTFLGMTQIMVSLERDIEYTELPKEEEVEYTPTGDAPKRNTKGKDSVAELHRVDKAWPSEGRIDFQDFSASYRPHVLNDSLKHVTFTVNAREKVGIVGRTGAGKSSLVLALLRVLKSTGGRILIDNVDIATVPLSRLRTAITVIPQDPSLVRGTLRANLDPMHRHSDEELWQVLRQAHLSDFVSSQPLKLMLETGDGGGKLSAGQRQLVCLARALLRNSRILVLDEATSQMDGDTDSLIQATLRDSFANFTLLTVAHRLHTVLDYDKILVMSEGSVAEYGTAQQLLNDSNSLFYDMAMKAGIVSGDSTAKNRLLPSEAIPHICDSQQL